MIQYCWKTFMNILKYLLFGYLLFGWLEHNAFIIQYLLLQNISEYSICNNKACKFIFNRDFLKFLNYNNWVVVITDQVIFLSHNLADEEHALRIGNAHHLVIVQLFFHRKYYFQHFHLGVFFVEIFKAIGPFVENILFKIHCIIHYLINQVHVNQQHQYQVQVLMRKYAVNLSAIQNFHAAKNLPCLQWNFNTSVL